jgi:TonB family protein
MKYAASLLMFAAFVFGGAPVSAQDKDIVYTAGRSGVTHPVVIKEVKPRYPKALLEAKKGAVVVVHCIVATDGLPTELRVKKPGDPDFDREAVKALSEWRFKPGLKDGKPVPVRVEVELTFTPK